MRCLKIIFLSTSLLRNNIPLMGGPARLHLLTLAGPFWHCMPTAKTVGAIANLFMTAQWFVFKQVFRMSLVQCTCTWWSRERVTSSAWHRWPLAAAGREPRPAVYSAGCGPFLLVTAGHGQRGEKLSPLRPVAARTIHNCHGCGRLRPVSPGRGRLRPEADRTPPICHGCGRLPGCLSDISDRCVYF